MSRIPAADDIPTPSCDNRDRTTTKCHRSCCRKPVVVREDTTRQVQFSWRIFNSNYFWCEEELEAE